VAKINLHIKNSIQKCHFNNSIFKKFSKNFNKIVSQINLDIKNKEKTINILSDDFKFNFRTKDLEKFKKFKTIVLIGMGGSILGAEAINNFLKKKIKKKIYFFDNIDSKKILEFKKKEELNKSLFLVISKSGNTIETISNFLSLNIIKKNSKNIIIISEKKDNLLYLISIKFNLFFIEHKNYIGGRYSIFSETGIIPAFLMGINISKFRKDLKRFTKTKERTFLKESVLKLSSIINKKKYTNLIFLNYVPELEKFLYWCQQLIAESLGKKGKGFLPVISNVPKDHHSLLQLYLDGPKDKIFHIFSIDENLKKKINTKKISNRLGWINKKSINDIKIAQKKALIRSLKEKKIPFREFKLKKLNEETLGELFSYFILETVIIGKLINVNPFDQPAVEHVKKYTKNLLN
jgi:glucose-6-phosphate isomerase